MTQTDEEKLDAMIALLGKGDRNSLIDNDEAADILLLLLELKKIQEDKAKELLKRAVEALTGHSTGCHGLSREEADLLLDTYGVEAVVYLQIEFESGPCRLCEGRGKVEQDHSTDCFGNIQTRPGMCFTCNGTGTDPKRIRLPHTM